MFKRKKILFGIFIIIVIGFFPFGDNQSIEYIERSSGQVKTEKVMGEYWLRWLYNNPLGKLSLNAIVKRKVISEWYGNRMDSPESVDKINDFVETYNIDLSEVKKQTFTSFNDFFIRELKSNARKIDTNKNVLISPADGKIFAYQNIDKQDFIVKGYKFNVQDFLNNNKLSINYKNGALIIVRLCPTDYHRFHFPVDGTILENKKIEGDLYSVSPIALRKKIEILCQNKREYTVIKTKNFGNIIMAEVGATMVGSIIQTYKNQNIKKAEEKGYFKFGGSTIVLIFEKDKIKIDKDLILNTKNGLETEVKMGEQIGVKLIAN